MDYGSAVRIIPSRRPIQLISNSRIFFGFTLKEMCAFFCSFSLAHRFGNWIGADVEVTREVHFFDEGSAGCYFLFISRRVPRFFLSIKGPTPRGKSIVGCLTLSTHKASAAQRAGGERGGFDVARVLMERDEGGDGDDQTAEKTRTMTRSNHKSGQLR